MLTGGKPEALFAKRLSELIEHSTDILDIGTPQRFAKELRAYEEWFGQKRYVAAGYKPSMLYGKYNCDCHQDIESMTFHSNSFDGVICIEVLEHTVNPFQAVKEIKRVLREGGYLLLTVPFLAQYHGKSGEIGKRRDQSHEHYPDFWRFTHEGLALLFSDFRKVEIIPLDGPIEFRLKQFYLGKLLSFKLFRWFVDLIDVPRLGKATSRHMVFGVK